MNKLFIGLISIIVTTSCVSSVNSLQPEVVSRSDAQKQQYVVFGTIRDTNRVTIEDDRERLELLQEQQLVAKLAKKLQILNQNKILQLF